MTSILDGSDADESEKVRLYNQALLRYNDMTKARAAKPIPVVVEVKKKEAAATTMPTTGVGGRTGGHRGNASQNATNEGTSVAVGSNVERKRRVDPQRCGDTWQVTRSISFTIYYEIEKHPIPSDGSSSPTKCAPPTYPWNWSVTSQGDYTCKRNAVNGLRRNVLRRRNGRLYKFPIRSVRPFRRRLGTVTVDGAAAIETTPTLLRS